MLACGGEELAIHDHEGFEPYRVEEFTSLAELRQIVGLVAKHGRAALVALNIADGDVDRARELVTEGYRGEWDNAADYVEEFCRDCHDKLPDWVSSYVDWKGMARDWELNGDITTVEHDGKVYVFDGHL